MVIDSQPRAPIQRKESADFSGGECQIEATSSGEPLPEEVRAEMESVMGMDFSAVRIHVGPQAESIGALAFTRGMDIFFAPGQYQPSSEEGQRLLGHELTHVVQQAQGRVTTTMAVGGIHINDDVSLEREADAVGARAAHRPATPHRSTPSVGEDPGRTTNASNGARSFLQRPASASDGVVQGSFISFAIKMGAKQAAKGMLKNFIKTQIKSRIKKLAIKKFARQFAKEADQILDILEDPWWVTAIGFIPIAGDAFDLARLPKQIKRAIDKADALEEKVKKILRIQHQWAEKLIPATLKHSDSYFGDLAKKSYAELVQLASSDPRAAKMKKLIEQQRRLMDKL
ncbi:MAG: DUF4157 domain-containing protein [Myxococcota bacterium]